MTDLDEMTKDELLEYAQELGVSPANAGMSKAEIREGIDEHLAPGQQVTTTSTKDYLNRLLVNPTPGTSNATDYLGRAVTAGNKDYMARTLVP
jgi:hypothetical protein